MPEQSLSGWTTQNLVTIIAAGLAFVASLIAAGSSVFNVRLARFARERWWERKADAYARIIEALSGLVYYYEQHYDAELEHRDLDDLHKKEMSDFWRKGDAEIKRAAAVGAFLISADAEAALKKMRQGNHDGIHPNNWFALLEADYSAASECLRAVVEAAKKDLAQR